MQETSGTRQPGCWRWGLAWRSRPRADPPATLQEQAHTRRMQQPWQLRCSSCWHPGAACAAQRGPWARLCRPTPGTQCRQQQVSASRPRDEVYTRGVCTVPDHGHWDARPLRSLQRALPCECHVNGLFATMPMRADAVEHAVARTQAASALAAATGASEHKLLQRPGHADGSSLVMTTAFLAGGLLMVSDLRSSNASFGAVMQPGYG